MSRILVTGASGFVGSRLSEVLHTNGNAVIGTTRTPQRVHSPATIDMRVLDDISGSFDWRPMLRGVDQIIHTAARVHVMDEKPEDALTSYRAVNVAGTRRLAEQAADSGVRRFVFLSSIKVNGEETRAGCPYRSDDEPRPVDSYGKSKCEAERALFEVSRDKGLEVVVIRPPLVYGPGVGANFRKIIGVLQRGIPLPLAAVRNRRSMVYLDNLVDLIVRCVDAPEASGQVFLVSDGTDLSTPELLRALASGLGRTARLFSMPTVFLRAMGALTGKSKAMLRLTSSLQVDIDPTCERLSWRPPVSTLQGLQQTAVSFNMPPDSERAEC